MLLLDKTKILFGLCSFGEMLVQWDFMDPSNVIVFNGKHSFHLFMVLNVNSRNTQTIGLKLACLQVLSKDISA